ncbi:GNAT family N-acetyltransferase [Pseudoxanthomonas sp. z9]|uniref:GNAT family N-acetyltransferase n=1 Tax=Pseudoxanthomonas sp. z9 TaxID=2584942 RepID=UPI0015E8C33A|nr:GNAT family N-acetyltransferase [Pseudoxanthomonas sp. z9]MCL6713117.1 GNAT family N-acetyltransferase [Pseudomonas sp. R2.Fl]
MNLFPALVPRSRVSPPTFPAMAGYAVTRVSRRDIEVLMALCDLQHDQGRYPATEGREASAGLLELMEALFDPPLRAWAWVARDGEAAVGYAAATVGFSLLERGYYLRLESLYVDPAHRGRDVETRLLASASETASQLGCFAVQWQQGTYLPPLQISGASIGDGRSGTLRLSIPTAS